MNKISSAWTHDLKGDAKKRMQDQLMSNHYVFDKLDNILEKLAIDYTWRDYDNPSWSHKQAHDNGYNEALYELKKLIRPMTTEGIDI